MKNVTVTLDAETARWARLEAARRDLSVSSLIRELLQSHMAGQEAYDSSMRRYLERPPRPLKEAGGYPARDEIHERAGLR